MLQKALMMLEGVSHGLAHNCKSISRNPACNVLVVLLAPQEQLPRHGIVRDWPQCNNQNSTILDATCGVLLQKWSAFGSCSKGKGKVVLSNDGFILSRACPSKSGQLSH